MLLLFGPQQQVSTLTYGEGWTADHLNATNDNNHRWQRHCWDNVLQNWRCCHSSGWRPDAGSITVTATFTPDVAPAELFSENSIDYTFSVAKAELTVTADDDATRVYGEDPKVYDNTDYEIAGFVFLRRRHTGDGN